MNDYELMIILHPRLNADETSNAIEAIQNRITESGGALINTDVWGRRRLAYPIQHVLEGTYVLYTFEIEPTSTRQIESWLGINESVIRHLLIRGIIPYDGPDTRGSDRDRDRDQDRDRDDRRDDAVERAPAAAAAPAAAPATEAPAAEPAAAAEQPADAAASETAPAADAGEPETAAEAPAAND